MSEKLFIVYEEPKDRGEVHKRTMTKSDMYWFGIDERLALQSYRTLARNLSSNWVAHIKAIDLDSLPDYTTKKPVDDMIGKLNSMLGKLNRISPHRLHSRGIANQEKGSVTFSIQLTDTGKERKHESVVHKEYVESFYLEQAAFNSVFEIILDKYLKDVEFTVPTKINVNGKTIRKFEPTNQN